GTDPGQGRDNRCGDFPARVRACSLTSVGRGQAPQPHGVVLTAGQGPVAVGRDGDAPDAALVAGEPLQWLRPADVPQVHDAVAAAGQDALAAGQQRGAEHLVGVGEAVQLLARGDLPDAGHAVGAAGHCQAAFGGERHAVDHALVGLPALQRLLVVVQVPQVNPAGLVAAEEEAAVGRDGDAVDGAHVAAVKAGALAGLRVPGPHGAVRAGGVERIALGVEGDGADAHRVATEDTRLLVALGVPQPGLVVAARGDPLAVRGDGHRPHRLLVALELPQPLARLD